MAAMIRFVIMLVSLIPELPGLAEQAEYENKRERGEIG
jgi:hypothetical protein